MDPITGAYASATLVASAIFAFPRISGMLVFAVVGFIANNILIREDRPKLKIALNVFALLTAFTLGLNFAVVSGGYVGGQLQSSPELTTSWGSGILHILLETLWISEQFLRIPDHYAFHLLGKVEDNELRWEKDEHCDKVVAIVLGWLEPPTAAITTQKNLLSLGYCSVAISMKHVNTRYPEHKQNLAKTLTKLVEEHKEITIISHSYGCPQTLSVLNSNKKVRDAVNKSVWLACAHNGTRLVSHVESLGLLGIVTSAVTHTLDLQEGSSMADEHNRPYSWDDTQTLSVISKSDTIVYPREKQHVTGTPNRTVECAHNYMYVDVASQELILSFVTDKDVKLHYGDYQALYAGLALVVLFAITKMNILTRRIQHQHQD
eukprot:m.9263 g.9263  ORF g.9263 m.9263 type:complete len:377 (+) comp4032_c0_seq1:251-1381(+)